MKFGEIEINGLTDIEVQNSKNKGRVNNTHISTSKTIGQIVYSNIFTLFNFINIIIFILILTTGKYINTLFMGVIVSNTLIGIVQEIRAKKKLDKLKLVTALKSTVVRNGTEIQIPVSEIVMDDICILKAGDQVSCDSELIISNELEVDESLLTGESEPVNKNIGDQLLSGSFIIAGNGIVKVRNVGINNYAEKLSAEAKKYKRAHSEILTVISKIIKLISYIIFPVGILLFVSQFFRTNVTWQDALLSSATGIIGMIPEGLVLLTTIAFAAGVVKLAQHKTIIQELAGIEVLARVNTLCLDKTGTLTKGILEVDKVIPFQNSTNHTIDKAVSGLIAELKDNNSTARALSSYFKNDPKWTAQKIKPFSSSRKWSGATFEDVGTFIIGAPEFILNQNHAKELDMANELANQGYRVVVLVHSEDTIEDNKIPTQILPLAIITLLDTVRPEAKKTLEYFAKNDVNIKVISGDNVATVVAVAERLELKNADKYIDATQIPDDAETISEAAGKYTIFGRVKPHQKKQLIQALKSQNNIVAMTGDGVNDILALRESDCSIAMESGSDAAKNTSHIVLLNSDFTSLPNVVAEGRQIINNIERVATLFLAKTTFSVILSVTFILIGASYPFFPIHQTLIGNACIGIPAFFLAIEKNSKRVVIGFFEKVIMTALPGGIVISINVILVQILHHLLNLDISHIQLSSVLVTGIGGFVVLYNISKPLNIFRGLVLTTMIVIFFGTILLFNRFLELPQINIPVAFITGIIGTLTPLLISVVKFIIEKITSIKQFNYTKG